jgi:hypothetical protein
VEVSRERIAWAAGLFEGEGYFAYQLTRGKHLVLRAGINMTDEDVITKFQSVIGGQGKVYPYISPHCSHHKKQYRLLLEGFERFQFVATLFWPWLGERRRARIKELLSMAREYYAAPAAGVGRPRGSRNRRVA